MKKVVIIPARYSSSRLPGKPLQDIAGKPMIIRVCEAVDASLFSDVVVATDDKRIEDCVKRAGYKVVMTKEDHVSGTDRLVARLLENSAGASVATLYETVAVKEAGNPNIVKLVEGKNHRVLYFSRAGIPFDRDNVRTGADVLKRHVGVYAYRKSALDEFVTYPEGELESLEKLEQLRFMENGHSIVAEKSVLPIPVGVDTAEDLEAVRKLFEESA